jgi:mRNA-degrading endonuclease RelE of RelBE toxin-antitoxin system
VICQFKKAFLRDLAELPATYRKRIEKLVFEEFPMASGLPGKLEIRKIQGYATYESTYDLRLAT